MNNIQHNFFTDLHIHIGRTGTGKPVKITGSRNLTLLNILEESSKRKGLDIIGIIDCHVPEVLAELRQLIREGLASPCQGGGIRYGSTTLILGTEIEIYDETCHGPIHLLCYFPTLEEMSAFSHYMSGHQKNITLSSQRSYVAAKTLQRKVKEMGGLFIPAHIFTPFKSLYGKGVKQSLAEILHPELIDAVELGLSSDTSMADQIEELHGYSFVTNSDAHSLAKIGREYQMLTLSEPDFSNVKKALHQKDNQSIVANYGLDPKLGKYHIEVTARLEQIVQGQVQGSDENESRPTLDRPPYIHQVPLEYIPKLGPKSLNRLVEAFGSEMKVIHSSTREELEKYVPSDIASLILSARQGNVRIQMGGSGKYGKVSYHHPS
jgi:uncharacterized protein (TIGR00375 family)